MLELLSSLMMIGFWFVHVSGDVVVFWDVREIGKM